MQYSCGPVHQFMFEGPRPRTLQIFSAKILSSSWPLEVYGLIAIRDFIDPQRIMVFNQDREDYKIIMVEVSSLFLYAPFLLKWICIISPKNTYLCIQKSFFLDFHRISKLTHKHKGIQLEPRIISRTWSHDSHQFITLTCFSVKLQMSSHKTASGSWHTQKLQSGWQ